MERKKTIALVAHDNMKPDLVEWADWNRELLLCHSLVCTGTTGRMVADVLIGKKGDGKCRLDIRLLKSGPLGGDQQLGAMIAEGQDRRPDIFLGPDGGPAARRGCEGASASGDVV